MSELGEYAGEEHDRVGLLAVRLRIERIVVVGRDARRLYPEDGDLALSGLGDLREGAQRRRHGVGAGVVGVVDDAHPVGPERLHAPALERLPLRLRVLGEHHVINALAALTAARELGVSLRDGIARLETVEIAERWRMQPLGESGLAL
jgi:UDP-N-acetylmuramyl pentapeptide synthase